MTVEEAIRELQKENPKTELHICHWAKLGTQRNARIYPLASVEHRNGRLCLVEGDDHGRYLAER